jgi:hypothetical protein
LIDIPQCISSGYAILDPPNQQRSTYAVRYQLGSDLSNAVVDEGSRLRRTGATQNVTMTFTGIDDGTDTLKCAQLAQGGSQASFGKAGRDIQQIRTVHGALMFFAWIFLVPLGIMIARYFKHLGHKWYLLHSGILTVASLATIVSGIVIFEGIWPTTTFQNFRDRIAVAHASIGVIVILMGAIAQPILGKLADYWWSADRKVTPVFPDKLHMMNGRIMMMLAIINIALGIYIFDTNTTSWIIAIVVILLIFSSLFALFEYKKPKGGYHSKVPTEAGTAE